MSGERWTLYFCEKCGSRSTDHDPGDCGAGLRALTVVPASAVADAVRAERERVLEALRERMAGPPFIGSRRTDGEPMGIWVLQYAHDFIAALPPADGPR